MDLAERIEVAIENRHIGVRKQIRRAAHDTRDRAEAKLRRAQEDIDAERSKIARLVNLANRERYRVDWSFSGEELERAGGVRNLSGVDVTLYDAKGENILRIFKAEPVPVREIGDNYVAEGLNGLPTIPEWRQVIYWPPGPEIRPGVRAPVCIVPLSLGTMCRDSLEMYGGPVVTVDDDPKSQVVDADGTLLGHRRFNVQHR